ncbi:uncharacterized protein LOC125315227 [Rhodamnia argentea]|uniref:Uncharacterized protein LOC125315227 n=1 Tax=Rhodamnia argentea TaxID=178133 RepID=A0ABM3HG97_9MYRT|nr:uncharacterized protein LOC125315227 [Rhodamnia argentea]
MGRRTRERAAAIGQVGEATVIAQGVNVNRGNDNGNRQMHRLVEQFLKLKPTKFTGKGDPEATPRWIEDLEKAFEVLGCTEEEKVTLYFSKTAREQKMLEFQQLRQNHMTIDQYEAEFSRLSKYTPRMVENPLDRARRFRDGLRPELRDRLIPPNPRDYDELYERGQMVERDMKERAAASGSRFMPVGDNRRFGKRPMKGNRRFIPPVGRNNGKSAYRSNWSYQLCGRRHGNGPCPSRTRACFKCGKFDHHIRNCPELAPE